MTTNTREILKNLDYRANTTTQQKQLTGKGQRERERDKQNKQTQNELQILDACKQGAQDSAH